MLFTIFTIAILSLPHGYMHNYSQINLPDEHMPYYFNSFPEVAEICRNDSSCPYKNHLDRKVCWGYEPDCTPEHSYSRPVCQEDHQGWVSSKEEQSNTFYRQGDFGYIQEQLQEMMVMCEPTFIEDSSLECSKHLRFCRGRNIMIDFTDLIDRKEPIRYKMDVLKDGQIGGYCMLHETRLHNECDQISPLQTWGPELRYFSRLLKRPITDKDCDTVIEKPTFVMKIDATVNMYHHFCDFFNLYASLHVNGSHPSTFSADNHILIWESYTYQSSFESVWEAFTSNPLWDLKTFRGDKVCFKNIVFPLLPRMIFGLYYNTPIIWGCEKSGLFHAFSKHILHRLRIPEHKHNDKKIRITLLSRETKYRQILNENMLLDALRKNKNYIVKRVVYSRRMSFKKQLEHTRNTDLFIGIHGAGLTHLLFLPDWAVVFEFDYRLFIVGITENICVVNQVFTSQKWDIEARACTVYWYNCEDEHCYMDLARLRGVKYITWQHKHLLEQEDQGHHPDGGAHAKFTNYAFNVDEFLRLVKIGAKYIVKHKAFQEFVNNKHDEL